MPHRHAMRAMRCSSAAGSSLERRPIAAITFMEDSPCFKRPVRARVPQADGHLRIRLASIHGRPARRPPEPSPASHRIKQNTIQLARAVMGQSEARDVHAAGRPRKPLPRKLGFRNGANSISRRSCAGASSRRRQTEAQKALIRSGLHTASLFRHRSDDNYLTDQIKHGTVGCVALGPAKANLAAGHLDGWHDEQKFWRAWAIRPSLVPAPYANNANCAVSATGWGEIFHPPFRGARHRRTDGIPAGPGGGRSRRDDRQEVGKLGGDGGVICIDRAGNVAMPFQHRRECIVASVSSTGCRRDRDLRAGQIGATVSVSPAGQVAGLQSGRGIRSDLVAAPRPDPRHRRASVCLSAEFAVSFADPTAVALSTVCAQSADSSRIFTTTSCGG